MFCFLCIVMVLFNIEVKMNKLISPIFAIIILICIFLGSIGHVMYGSCQTSKFHYICQFYWMPDYLPKWMHPNKKFMSSEFQVYDHFHGAWKTWYRNGMKRTSASFLNEIPVGKYESWYENGVRESVGNNIIGKAEGKYEGWHLNGSRKYIFIYVNGYLDGLFEEWHDNGIKASTGLYVKGKLEGKFEVWHKNGKRKRIGYYINDLLDGQEIWFDENENKIIELNWIKNIRQGESRNWFPNGQIKCLEVYINGKQTSKDNWNLDGSLDFKEYFDDEGKFLKRELFKNNELVNTETE